MGKALDLTGQRYGRLMAVASTDSRQARNFIWRFRCDCGNEVDRPSGEVRRGGVASCGCLRTEMKADQMRSSSADYNKARSTHGMAATPTFVSWDSMKQRCLNGNRKSYADYGGRGIVICPRWLESFDNFVADMGERPSGTTLERDKVNGNYEPGNCRWATPKEQGNNRRNNRMVTHDGIALTVKQWAERVGICSKALTYRLNNGWSVAEALTRTVNHGNGWARGERKF